MEPPVYDYTFGLSNQPPNKKMFKIIAGIFTIISEAVLSEIL